MHYSVIIYINIKGVNYTYNEAKSKGFANVTDAQKYALKRIDELKADNKKGLYKVRIEYIAHNEIKTYKHYIVNI